MYLLGKEYEGSDVTERNLDQARDWYHAAAEYTTQQFVYTRYYDPAPIAAKARAALGKLN